MMQQIWKSFPRLLEQRINQLLDEAQPTDLKAFQLYKSCQAENLWSESYEKFSKQLQLFCSVPRIERTKGQFDRYLERPMDTSTFDQFHFTFRTSQIEPSSLRQIASWAHHLLRANLKADEGSVSINVLEKTLIKLTQPTAFDKDIDIEFSDFCDAWQKVAAPTLDSEGRKQLQTQLGVLRHLDQQCKQAHLQSTDQDFSPAIAFYLTQTEIDWTSRVQQAANTSGQMPKYPLKRGPEKIYLLELQKLVTLYNLLQLTEKFELIKHRESVRTTILHNCEQLLDSKAA